MGTEISQDAFSEDDFAVFHQRLEQETKLLETLLKSGEVATGPSQGGYELESWLIDRDGNPAPDNERVIARMGKRFAVLELARFNIELNGQQQTLKGDALSLLHSDVLTNWTALSDAADSFGLRLLMIGSHPCARREDFSLANMSPLQRYRAINEQIFKPRQRQPIKLDIHGEERLQHRHHDVMLEAATTSFQIHLRCDPDQAAHLYNASKIISGPLVALSANSPFLFGKNLWAESRIPIFEQAVDVGESDLTKRVSFGLRYAENSIFEIFQANLERYPVLLPHLMEQPIEQLAHLRLHNGTIWRWNRPLVGFDDDGMPHIRIEQRVVPAGPTASDSIANAAFYFGLSRYLLDSEPALEQQLAFSDTRDNFYQCARHGLQATVNWPGHPPLPVRELILNQLLPQAAIGLQHLDIDSDEIGHWLGIIRERADSGRTGSQWQRAWVNRHGREFRGMISAYHFHQQSDVPVHRWPLD